MSIGKIAFLGSGETSLAGGRIFESLARILSTPLRIAIMETPAGFELNSAQVAGRVADFLKTRLQNYKPVIDLIPARKKDTPFSPDDPEVLKPLLTANFIFMGAGSPTYAIRQLQGTLAWDLIRARHRMGATLVFSSAATISISAWALPVYEIYKVGEDVFAKEGLDLFGDFGFHLSFIPHWNNSDGGVDLDTSRCFIGMERFKQWRGLIPAHQKVVGLDEHTGLLVDFEEQTCEVSGVSSVSVIGATGEAQIYASGAKIPLSELGNFHTPEPLEKNIHITTWQTIQSAQQTEIESTPEEILSLLEERQQARTQKDFKESDRLRDAITALGWSVQDGKDGQKVVKM